MNSPKEVYREVRDADLGILGAHWDGIGVCLGDGVWGDPEALGLLGEYEVLYGADRMARRASRVRRGARKTLGEDTA